jgi:hypothetical protein
MVARQNKLRIASDQFLDFAYAILRNSCCVLLAINRSILVNFIKRAR